jgi:hypothetical protein
MLTITNKQLEVFSAYMMDSFIKKAKIHLRQKLPVSTRLITDETLHGIIVKGTDKAAGYNIIEREDVLPFIEYMVSLGNDFDVFYSWARKILRTRNIAGSEKIADLININPIYPESEND